MIDDAPAQFCFLLGTIWMITLIYVIGTLSRGLGEDE